ncbi:NlpC/P60 family protein [Sulfitobacter sp. S190]|uniref:C40 family peptidase n=1 Tax=Sulfitobacter sp. S190 TaxID=2867022 RepID=UPI0021A83907|nr:NlpC/P60 family protein [Sulfitobacter sp. S190]UWR22281.1 C40 family peptidase [Sulfitobacter sp. S190]
MSDPRLTPDPTRQTRSEPARVVQPVTDLLRHPGGPRDRQLLLGAEVTVMDDSDGFSYVQSAHDGYCGFVRTIDLQPPLPATHKVSAAATHAYLDPDFKSADRMALSHGCRVAVTGTANGFAGTIFGHIPEQHLAPLAQVEKDPAAVAALFLGTPYLWGGNSRAGIDCSGLVQGACVACGLPCPADSDMQERTLGSAMLNDESYRRNDLLFWKGHVALVWDAKTLLHANAHAMATVFEPLEEAIDRIALTDGPVTMHRRLGVL